MIFETFERQLHRFTHVRTTTQQSPHWLQWDAPNSPPKLPFPFNDNHPCDMGVSHFTSVGEYNPTGVGLLIDQVYYGILNNATQLQDDVWPICCSHRQCQVCCCKQLVASAARAAAGSSSALIHANYRMEKRGALRCSHGYHLQPHTPSNTPIPRLTPLTTPESKWHLGPLSNFATEPFLDRQTDRWSRRETCTKSAYTLIASDALKTEFPLRSLAFLFTFLLDIGMLDCSQMDLSFSITRFWPTSRSRLGRQAAASWFCLQPQNYVGFLSSRLQPFFAAWTGLLQKSVILTKYAALFVVFAQACSN